MLGKTIAQALALLALAAAALGCAQAGAPAATPSTTPSATHGATPGGSPLPSGSVTIELTASGLAFDTTELHVPAELAFTVLLDNRDRDMHNFEVRDESGNSLYRGELFGGPAERIEQVPALTAGSYTFLCTAHPYMKGTLEAN